MDWAALYAGLPLMAWLLAVTGRDSLPKNRQS
jgi:hypothetical protein